MKDNEYKELMVSLFIVLLDIYSVSDAIVLLYKINSKNRGKKI